jgi:hypothetical protein
MSSRARLVSVLGVAVLATVAVGVWLVVMGRELASQDAEARAAVQTAVLSLEAYAVDHGRSYRGATVDGLRAYDAGVTPALRIVRATAAGYCVEATVGSMTAHLAGPAEEPAPGRCPAS